MGWRERVRVERKKKVILLPLFANERERERANGTLDDGVILLFDVLNKILGVLAHPIPMLYSLPF